MLPDLFFRSFNVKLDSRASWFMNGTVKLGLFVHNSKQLWNCLKKTQKWTKRVIHHENSLQVLPLELIDEILSYQTSTMVLQNFYKKDGFFSFPLFLFNKVNLTTEVKRKFKIFAPSTLEMIINFFVPALNGFFPN